MADGQRATMLALALRLNKTLRDIEAMEHEEFIGWMAFLQMQAENDPA